MKQASRRVGGLRRGVRLSLWGMAVCLLLQVAWAEVQAAAPPQDPPSSQPASRHDDPYFERTRPLTAVSRHGREFLTAFNAAVERPRIVALLSPTDPQARQEAVRLNRLLQSEPDSHTVVFAVWIADHPGDSPSNTLRATGLLPDSGVTHFHDLHGFVKRSLASRLELGPEGSPALLLHYRPGTLWLDLPPRPSDVRTPASN